MCGIAGEVNYNEYSEYGHNVFLKVQDSLEKRGPDQNGIYSDQYIHLVHTRLCVVDIEKGRQPMIYNEGSHEYVLVYNGELYNTKDIRNILIQKGHRFNGHSDTEVVLKAYLQWGAECVERFNGIFAFAVWDKVKEKLFIARDRIGVKPFFYTVKDNIFIFGSELKALLEHPLVEPEIDINGISEIMLLGPGRTPGCGVFKDIEELKPAFCGYYSKEGLKTYQYWHMEDKEHTENFSKTAEKVRHLVTDAIKRQTVSDVPVCAFLSGGLDSSIISAVAGNYLMQNGKPFSTFSVYYDENEKYFKESKFQPESDDKYIDLMKEFLGVEHTKIVIGTKDLTDALFSAVDARDLPGMADVDSSLLLFCREVKKQATVALSGECADELFGGYPWYRDENIRSIDGFPWAQSTAYRQSFLNDELADRIDGLRYVHDRYLETVNSARKQSALSPLESRMKEMVRLNMDWFMQTLLDRKDRMSMYNGLEVRVPFCDYRIAEYLYAVPWEFKNYEGREKGLLRKAMEGILPDEILYRKKSPYPKTHHPEYLEAVSKLLLEIIHDPSSPLLKIAKKSALEKLIDTDNETPWYGQLMTTPQTIAYFVQVNYWLERYKINIIE